MMMLILTIAIFLAAFIYCYPLTFRLYYDGTWRLFWLPRLWGGYAQEWEIPSTAGLLNRWRHKKQNKSNLSLSAYLKQLPNYKNLLRRIFKSIFVDQLELDLEIGMPSPLATSILAGACWAGLGSLQAVLAETCKNFPEQPQIKVQTNFGDSGLQSRLLCIFRIRVGDIISIILSVLWLRFSYLKPQGRKVGKW
jgi:hypothetical protein